MNHCKLDVKVFIFIPIQMFDSSERGTWSLRQAQYTIVCPLQLISWLCLCFCCWQIQVKKRLSSAVGSDSWRQHLTIPKPQLLNVYEPSPGAARETRSPKVFSGSSSFVMNLLLLILTDVSCLLGSDHLVLSIAA